MAGALPFMTSFSVDGISSQRIRFGGPSRELFPSVESIEEFKVTTAGNNAEFMQETDLTTITKSGSNQLHGTAFWFFQDSAMTAATRFTPKDAAGKPIKPEVRTNSFGGSAGGPVLRNRAFFFATYEGVRQPNETTLSQIVPPDAWRNGDLSSVGAPIRNPATGQPFAGNRIPINPASARILDLFYERQNQATGAAIDRPNLVLNAPGEFTVDGFDGRGDYVVSPNQKVFARLSIEECRQAGSDRQLEHEAGRFVQADGSAATGRISQLGRGIAAERDSRRLVEHRREGQLYQRRSGGGPDGAGRPDRAAAFAGKRRISRRFSFARWLVHPDRRRQAVQYPLASGAGQRDADVGPRRSCREERSRHPVRRIQGSNLVL